MPATAARPERTHALIVGIERYAAGSQWDLDGPLNDALAIRGWLLSCGVPAEQIHLHVAPLEKNQAKLLDLQCNIQKADEQAIRETIQRIKNKSPQPDDLLFLYWAGHGLISQAQQCLLLAEATDADMKSYGVDNGEGSLCASFANEHCPSFRQQIFLFDTCRSFHRQPDCPLPVVPLPSGNRLQKSQFLLFASQEGQAAKNQGQKRCGLFTEVLLEQLRANQAQQNAWPPDMDGIATAVQQSFKENMQQYPVWKRYRDSKGNELIDPFPEPTALNPGLAAELMDLTAAVQQLAELLAEHLGRPNQRNDVMRYFRMYGPGGNEVIKNSVIGNSPLEDYREILMNSLEYVGSLHSLRKACLQLLGARAVTPIVDQAFSALLQALKAECKSYG